jgi:uncharacterized protein YdhG (YjbR/CyaY superfamily)
MQTHTTVDAYLKDLPEQPRAQLEKLRARIRSVVPDAVESIAYGMPAYKYRGRPLIYFGAAKGHVGIYGAIPAAITAADLAKYETSKGTIRFPFGTAIPAGLVKKILRARIAEIEASAAKRVTKKVPARGKASTEGS